MRWITFLLLFHVADSSPTSSLIISPINTPISKLSVAINDQVTKLRSFLPELPQVYLPALPGFPSLFLHASCCKE